MSIHGQQFNPPTHGSSGRPEYLVIAEIPCPNCGALMTTEDAGMKAQMANGVRFIDLPCTACDRLFTLEAVES
jgi:hypothetical protein